MAININTTYIEILTMIYLSKLIYYYHKKQILININETLEEYFKKYELIQVTEYTSENSEYIINCNDNSIEEDEYTNFTKESLLFLYMNLILNELVNPYLLIIFLLFRLKLGLLGYNSCDTS